MNKERKGYFTMTLFNVVFFVEKISILEYNKLNNYKWGGSLKKFLMNEFGQKQGAELYQLQQELFNSLLNRSAGKSKNQMKTMKSYILPRIALYQVLQGIPMNKNEAFDLVEKQLYYSNRNSMKMIQIADKLPGFYNIFRFIFSKMLKTDNWKHIIEKNNKEGMIVNITKCLWYDTCVEHNCPELCAIFCKSDIVSYGSLKKINFIRTQTLGMGGEYCDFQFLNNKSKKSK